MAREDYPEAWLWQGDVNGNGMIDMDDITIIAHNYKKPASEAPECDLDGDGWISILDLERAGRNFGLTYEVWLKQLEARRPLVTVLAISTFVVPLGIVGVLGTLRKLNSGTAGKEVLS